MYIVCFQTTNLYSEHDNDDAYRPYMERIRSTLSNNFVLPNQISFDRYQQLSSSVHCQGPSCKSFICYIDTLPIGHSVLIQLKAVLRYDLFQTVSSFLFISSLIIKKKSEQKLSISFRFQRNSNNYQWHCLLIFLLVKRINMLFFFLRCSDFRFVIIN